ncbi:hypothetical protein ACHAP5_005562 [Fusarium lateritium]
MNVKQSDPNTPSLTIIRTILDGLLTQTTNTRILILGWDINVQENRSRELGKYLPGFQVA